MPNNSNESFIRWQGRSLEQMSFVNNLLVALATGLLAFHTRLAFDNSISLLPTERCIAAFSVIFVFLSLVTGCWLACNRLHSFHLTAKVARMRETNKLEGIDGLRARLKKADRCTWCLLTLQTALFAIGASLLLASTLMRYFS